MRCVRPLPRRELGWRWGRSWQQRCRPATLHPPTLTPAHHPPRPPLPTQYHGGEPCAVCGHCLEVAVLGGTVPAAPPPKPPSAFPSEIVPGFLFLGSYDHASRHEILKTLGIGYILNVGAAWPSAGGHPSLLGWQAERREPLLSAAGVGSLAPLPCPAVSAPCRRPSPAARRCTRTRSPTTPSLPAHPHWRSAAAS